MGRLTPGVANFDVEIEDLCFHCDGETLAAELVTEFGYSIVGRGIGPQTAILTDSTLRIVRYEGSRWSVIVPLSTSLDWGLHGWMNLMARLSRGLNVDALFLGISDTAGAVEYHYYQAGDEIECSATTILSLERQLEFPFKNQRCAGGRWLFCGA
jgi:hypothetical protein